MSIVMGPVLGFRGCEVTSWRVGVLVVIDTPAPPALTANAASGSPVDIGTPVLLHSHGGRAVWRFDLAATRGVEADTVTYAIDGLSRTFTVPAVDGVPRVAYVSCNGFSEPKLMKRVADRNDRWTHLVSVHAAAAYHLLVMGGDQVYADEVWTRLVPAVHAWSELPREERVRRAFTTAMRKQVEAFYFELYLTRWAQVEPAAAMGSIPTLMMWDDHDIFDGWGSHSDAENACPVFQGIFGVARSMFEVFQLQTPPGTPAPGQLVGATGLSWGHDLGAVSIVAPDLRSERTNGRALGAASWNALVNWLERIPKGTSHVYFVSSIPVVYASFIAVERFLGVLPGEQTLEDDLRDHWSSPAHQQERIRLIHRLLAASRDKCVRVTILSGDVHAAALGVIESSRDPSVLPNANVINQLTSSGVVHPAPPGTVLWAIEHLMSGAEEPDRGITTRLLELPGTSHKVIGARNWLALEPDTNGRRRIWANWHVEGVATPFTKTIHPVD
ncbi:MAG: alkaline phosphatase family protein [Planctomycetes bacterium]|nr:alkaline phosphatase family protein [Planctomycetota bacterium]